MLCARVDAPVMIIPVGGGLKKNGKLQRLLLSSARCCNERDFLHLSINSTAPPFMIVVYNNHRANGLAGDD